MTLFLQPLRAGLRRALFVALAAGALAGCDVLGIDDRPNPNGPALDDILANPTEANLSNLAVGVEASSRVALGQYLVNTGVLGREIWRVSPSDPRFTQDLLGGASSVLDNNTFYITQPWNARYAAIRNANTLLLGLDANTTLSEAQKAAGRGYARTWIAYQYLLNLNLTFQNGIRFIEPGADLAGPIVGYDEALTRIAALLDQGAADLAGGSGTFFFPTAGVPGNVAEFARVNRALAARVDLYRGDNPGALDALAGSFIDRAADLGAGAFHVFSTGAGDIANPFFFPPASDGDALLVVPQTVSEIPAGDARRAKVFDRGAPRTFDGLTSQFALNVYPTPTSPIAIVRNGELLLIRAEARARVGTDLAGAIADLNVIRASAGLGPYAGAVTQAAVLDEVLLQRRYELLGEGHRWIDVRRYGRLGTLPLARPGDDVFDRFPIPESDLAGV